ncbi:MAG: hypothetical protein RBT75_21165 [Anaerolineae bacterium]|jgi:hypothetical protein|nr:hypothetical protein [Anaerolineae bacterium]
MNTFKCPACGALLAKDSAKCSACESDIDWQNGQPVVASTGSALKRVAIVVLIAVIAAALILAAVLLVIPRI